MSFNSALFTSYNVVTSDYSNIYVYNCGDDSFATVAAASYFDSLVNSINTGDKLIVRTNTSGLSFSGTFRNDGTNVYVDWDNTLRFETQMADISSSTTNYFSVPPAGVITEVYGTQWSAVTNDSAVITFSIATDAITGGALTVTTSGVAGTSYSATPTALNVTDGVKYVKAASNGGSSTTAIMTLGYKLICPAQI